MSLCFNPAAIFYYMNMMVEFPSANVLTYNIEVPFNANFFFIPIIQTHNLLVINLLNKLLQTLLMIYPIRAPSLCFLHFFRLCNLISSLSEKEKSFLITKLIKKNDTNN